MPDAIEEPAELIEAAEDTGREVDLERYALLLALLLIRARSADTDSLYGGILTAWPGEGGIDPLRSRDLATDRLRGVVSGWEASATARVGDTLGRELGRLADSESAYQLRRWSERLGVVLSAPMIPTLLDRVRWSGKGIGAHASRIGQATIDRIMRELAASMDGGLSAGRAIRQIRGTKTANFRDGQEAVTARSLTTLARDAVTATAAYTRLSLAQANPESFSRVQWVSVLDSRTSPICLSLSGRVFKLAKSYPIPPVHPNCRSTLRLVARDRQAPPMMDGQTWLSRQSREVQDEILGARRAALFREGKLKVKSLLKENLKPKGLDEY